MLTICQHLTGDVRTGKRTKNIRDKGVVYQNNILNIKLMCSCFSLRISSANSAAIVKLQSFSEIEISLHCQDKYYIKLCSYAVMQF